MVLLGAIDQGTSSSRFFVFDSGSGDLVTSHQVDPQFLQLKAVLVIVIMLYPFRLKLNKSFLLPVLLKWIRASSTILVLSVLTKRVLTWKEWVFRGVR